MIIVYLVLFIAGTILLLHIIDLFSAKRRLSAKIKKLESENENLKKELNLNIVLNKYVKKKYLFAINDDEFDYIMFRIEQQKRNVIDEAKDLKEIENYLKNNDLSQSLINQALDIKKNIISKQYRDKIAYKDWIKIKNNSTIDKLTTKK
ncbi:MAG: hypothetical protein SFY56_04565 [Bacteroidota bacterium]|nr:hypothetical protein [Bacteroidota bacterium]